MQYKWITVVPASGSIELTMGVGQQESPELTLDMWDALCNRYSFSLCAIMFKRLGINILNFKKLLVSMF